MMYQPDNSSGVPESMEHRLLLARATNSHGFWCGVMFASFGVAISFGLLSEMWIGIFTNFGLAFNGGVIAAAVIMSISCFGMIKGLKHSTAYKKEIEEALRALKIAEQADNEPQEK